MMAQGVLFVSHEATSSGAPTELLHFLRWFKANSGRRFSVMLARDGELTSAFQKAAETWSLERNSWHAGAFRRRFLTAAGLGEWAGRREADAARRFAARCSPALIYANSIASAQLVDVLALGVPVLTHVHELEFMFRALSSPSLARLLDRTRHFIACSNAVRQNLIQEHRVAPERIDMVHESIPIAEIRAQRSREQVLQELQIASGSLVVVGCGTINWIKGPDLFVQLARDVCRRRRDVYFVWIGGGPPLDVAQFEHDIRALGLSERIRLTGAVKETADYLAAADVFVLTSRQDSYPLAGLEAAALQKPIVCFAGAGGMPEFVEGDCGLIAPYLDITAMAGQIRSLLDSTDCRLKMGEASRRKVAQRHDVIGAAPQIMRIIEQIIAGD
jgi:glycosyltransferase involved in cell wall biosynthesis